ncbi:MAG: hypothetical protein KKG84_01015, partial [Candidatus Omnitrophica bacterium]|nr:hypothetical protein [Candidatus Omnitrophota bacterium]
LVFCCLLFMVPSGLRIYHSERLFLAEDTRTQCYDWITKNIAYGSAIALDATGPVFPRLKQTKELVEESFSNFNNPKFATPEGSMSYKVKLLLSNPDYPEDTYRILYLRKKISRKNRFLGLYPESLLDMDELRRQGIEYVVAHNILLSSYYKDFLEQLEEGSVLVKEFSPYKPGRGRIKPLEESSLAAAPFSFRELSDRERPGPVLRIYRLR